MQICRRLNSKPIIALLGNNNTGNNKMHILAMLLVMIIGLSIGTNATWFLGLPVMAAGLLCLNMGTKAWREKQEAFALFLGLCCGVILLVYSVVN
ncbi:hypothetical protein EI165_00340 [Pseudoalteromonas nigrifaciens]|uniref:hypothetical protein n=1 Tax=Pseudoalteromonas nigrifaciens TaxID=28109 RepID=UPI001787B981|nr:hypothetical protein [Pseudoalteromonas nigrifaciens]MBE0418568.1 hypothetical protein [Pseudoalteromonas nigrifaciens]